MKVDTVFSIDGKIVDRVFTRGNIHVYEYELDDDERILYFVQGGLVIFTQRIEAGGRQNEGFISSVTFEDVKQ